MSQGSSIEWTDATWNPVRGCSRVSEGCRNCYAERQAARFADFGCYAHGFAKRTEAGPRWTGRVELVPEKLDEPLRWKKPRRIFVNSMSDLFHERLSDDAVATVFTVMAACQQHTFQALTKRPERMRRWFEWIETDGSSGESPAPIWPLPNVWLGVSVEDQATADERIPLLLQTPAAVRFVSYEPALGPVDFSKWFIAARLGQVLTDATPPEHRSLPRPSLDWLIVGGESGPGARPFDIAWARSAVAQCKAAGVPVFVKQLGARPRGLPERRLAPKYRLHGATEWHQGLFDRKGGDMSEWPDDLRVREFPGDAA